MTVANIGGGAGVRFARGMDSFEEGVQRRVEKEQAQRQAAIDTEALRGSKITNNYNQQVMNQSADMHDGKLQEQRLSNTVIGQGIAASDITLAAARDAEDYRQRTLREAQQLEDVTRQNSIGEQRAAIETRPTSTALTLAQNKAGIVQSVADTQTAEDSIAESDTNREHNAATSLVAKQTAIQEALNDLATAKATAAKLPSATDAAIATSENTTATQALSQQRAEMTLAIEKELQDVMAETQRLVVSGALAQARAKNSLIDGKTAAQIEQNLRDRTEAIQQRLEAVNGSAEARRQGEENALTGENKTNTAVINAETDAIAAENKQLQTIEDQKQLPAKFDYERTELTTKQAESQARKLQADVDKREARIADVTAKYKEDAMPDKIQQQVAEDTIGLIYNISDLASFNMPLALKTARNSALLDMPELHSIKKEGTTISFLDKDGNVIVDENGMDNDGISEPATFDFGNVSDTLLKRMRPADHERIVVERKNGAAIELQRLKQQHKVADKAMVSAYDKWRMTSGNHAIIAKSTEKASADIYGAAVRSDGSAELSASQRQEQMLVNERIEARTQLGDNIHVATREEYRFPAIRSEINAEFENEEEGEKFAEEAIQRALAISANWNTETLGPKPDITIRGILQGALQGARQQASDKRFAKTRAEEIAKAEKRNQLADQAK